MRLKPQNSAKQLLEAELSELRSVRAALSEEITGLVQQKNLTISEVKAEGERLMASLRETERICGSKKGELLNEITLLEARKAEAMVPVTARVRAVEEREREAAVGRMALEKLAQELGEQRTILAIKTEEVADLRSALEEKHFEADRKLALIREAEEMQKKSLDALNSEWQVFREKEKEREQAHVSRETELVLREEAIATEKKWLVAERSRNTAEKRALKSERDAINAAFIEGRKKNYL